MNLGILVPLAPFLMVAAIVIVPAWLKSRERREMQQTVRAAIETGQALPPELIEALSKDIKPPKVASAQRDLRIGVILIAVSTGIALLGCALGMVENDALFPIVGSAAIPGVVGIAFVILSFFNPNKSVPRD
jgi:hypothetical protein